MLSQRGDGPSWDKGIRIADGGTGIEVLSWLGSPV
jgi:hypothetical protein